MTETEECGILVKGNAEKSGRSCESGGAYDSQHFYAVVHIIFIFMKNAVLPKRKQQCIPATGQLLLEIKEKLQTDP